MFKTRITLQAGDFINYSGPIEILPAPATNDFYDIFKIIWKYKFGTSSFDYNDKILFTVGDERIGTMQADVLSSASSVACISHANLCIDKECPRINLSEGLKLKLLGTPPTRGDGEVIIEVFYCKDGIYRVSI